MFKKDIYKYKDDKGRTIISPYRPNCEYEHMYRLIAQSEDYRLTNYVIFTQCVDIREKDLELWVEVHKDDLETPISQNEEVLNRLDTHDEIIDINMLALDELSVTHDELFTLLESLMVETHSMNEEMEVNPMVELYVVMVQRGLKTLEQVPARYREQVRQILEKVEKSKLSEREKYWINFYKSKDYGLNEKNG